VGSLLLTRAVADFLGYLLMTAATRPIRPDVPQIADVFAAVPKGVSLVPISAVSRRSKMRVRRLSQLKKPL
jgi:hypothetical protein